MTRYAQTKAHPCVASASTFLCAFCPQRRFELNRLADLPSESSVVYRGDTVFLTPDIAPIREGHLLVISYEHHLSAAQVAAVHGALFYSELAYICHWYEKVFGSPPQLFEHGSVAEDDGSDSSRCGSCIEHAHIHLLPEGTLDESLATVHLGVGEDISLEEFPRMASLEPYVYLATRSMTRLYRCTPPSRQLLRWLVGGGRLEGDSTWQARYQLPVSRRSFVLTLRSAQVCD